MSTAATLATLRAVIGAMTVVNEFTDKITRVSSALMAAGDGDIPPEVQKEADEILELSRLRRDAAIQAAMDAEGDTTG